MIVPHRGSLDTPFWHFHSSGTLSTDSVRNLLEEIPTPNYSFHWIWSLRLPHKIKLLFWLCSHNKLTTGEHLHSLKIINSPSYTICHAPIELIPHVFLDCQMVQKFWLDICLNMHGVANSSLQNIHSLDLPLQRPGLHWHDFLPFCFMAHLDTMKSIYLS